MIFEKKNCPYCKKETESSEIAYKYEYNSYLESLKSAVQNKVELSKEIPKNLKLVKCKECKLIFFNNWFDSPTSKKMYNYKPHRVGWGSFFLFFDKKKDLKKHITRKLNIIKFLNKKIPNIINYAELNCPFSGLILLFAFAQNIKDFKINIIKKLISERTYAPSVLFKFL